MSSNRQAVSIGKKKSVSGREFLLTLHFYIGLFVGPFLFIAALTGLLYVLTPQIENLLYAKALYTQSNGQPRSLAQQASAASHYLDNRLDISAIRPAPHQGDTTRVMFSDPALGASENRTIFVDPVTLAVRGDMTTYGTSGTLPFRTKLDYLHRGLLLGDWGRYYSEVAASWLWVMVLGGVFLWATGSKRKKAVRDMTKAQQRRWIHATLGITLSGAILFFSITGLTWSQAAGNHITAWRNAIGWVTPAVSLSPNGGASDVPMEHHHMGDTSDTRTMSHHDINPDLALRDYITNRLDDVALAARHAGIDSPYMEIRTPKPGQAWAIREYDRRWPTQVDTVALNPQTLAVTSHANFSQFPLVAKLIQWGVAAHMGILFGLPNQIIVGLVAILLMVIILYAYAAWWARKFLVAMPLIDYWLRLPFLSRTCWLMAAIFFGWAFPALGYSLLVFMFIDVIRYFRGKSLSSTTPLGSYQEE